MFSGSSVSGFSNNPGIGFKNVMSLNSGISGGNFALPNVFALATPSINSNVQNFVDSQLENVLNLQGSTGSWDDESLISLAKDPSAVRSLFTEIGKEVVITKLVMLWLQKKQVGQEYSLILRKADGWLNKAIANGKLDQAKLTSIEAI